MHAWSDAGSHANAISARSPRHPSACGTRRPKSIIHDRPSERLAAGRSVASRRARLRTRWTLRPTADGAGCSARVRSSSLTPVGWTPGRQSRLNQKAHRTRNQRTARDDDVDGSSPPRAMSDRPRRGAELSHPLLRCQRGGSPPLLPRPVSGSPAARTTVATTMETERAPVKFAVIGDALVDITVGASSRPARIGPRVRSSSFSWREPSSPRRLRPRASPPPPPPTPVPLPPSLPPPRVQALWTRCPPPARTSRLTR